MRIYIPTRGRVDLQRTVERLPIKIHQKYKTTIACPVGEVRQFKAKYPYLNVLETPAGIHATRQAILDHARKDDPIALMLDDDLPTWCHRLPNSNKYVKANDEQIIHHFDEFAKRMKGYAHGAIGHRLFCQEQDPIYHNSRMLRALAYNTDKTGSAKFRLRVMEDFDMALQLMTTGHASIIYNAMVQDQRENNSAGGCSAYRTPELQAKAARELARLWPGIVTVVRRAPKRGWVGFGEERIDVRVNWRRAAQLGDCVQ